MKLTEFEQSLVSLGINVATAFSLPKSVGAIFGLIFANARPLSMDDCIERLEISKGSASQGLKFLQRMGAVKAVYQVSDRRTLYEPEVSLRRLLIGVLRENVMPHLAASGQHVDGLRSQLLEMEERGAGGTGNLTPEDRERLEERLDAIETWGKKGRLLLPLLERFLSGPLKDKNKLVEER